MRLPHRTIVLLVACGFLFMTAVVPARQAPPAGQAAQGAPPPQTPAQPPAGQRGGGQGGGRATTMTLTTTGWADGGQVAIKYTQAGDEVSPPLAWSAVPENAASFVLIVHDLDASTGNGETFVHWMVWNIPAATRSLPEGVPQGAELPGGMRQISATGPNYRGPAAPASGLAHHYAFELYALDSMIDVKPVGASVAETRAAVMAAMAGHVRGKAALIGLFKRAQ